MKKLLSLGCMMLLASAANASYLYWQIESDDEDATAILNSSITDTGSGSPVTVYAITSDDDGNAVLTPTTVMVPETVYAIDSSAVNSGYSYWVEISNSSVEATRYTGTEFQTMTYVDVADTTSMVDIAEGTVPVSTWHASSGSMSAPVPEPTSAILMMFGMAFLGLKRKNRSIA